MKKSWSKEIISLKHIAVAVRANFYPRDAWYNYIISKRLTLKCNPPVYKWLCFVIFIDVNNKKKC